MKLTAWRLVHSKYLNKPLTGEGAQKSGGRWNHKGTPIIYAAQAISLSVLEILARILDSGDLKHYRFRSVEFDDSQVQRIEQSELSLNWNSLPPTNETKDIGNEWAKSNQSLILAVPSVIIPIECNYLINPSHPEFRSLVIHTNKVKFDFDQRLLSFHRITA
ncbi:MAG: RES domain-containing protein [Candidatus Hinthialibacter antarcticus]|nr:RES domain-containing protein [Candidatus Hinthialibacter antarcticus]